MDTTDSNVAGENSNGHTSNGHTSNGHTSNGHTSNGHTSNGHTNNGHTSNGNYSSGYPPLPYPYTALTRTGVPLIDTEDLATPLANTLLHLSKNSAPSVRDIPHVMNAYNASTASRIERGVWAYFHPVVTELPTEAQLYKAIGVPISLLAPSTLRDHNDNKAGPSNAADRPEGRKERGDRGTPRYRRKPIPDWVPEELVFPPAIGQDLAQDWGRWAPLDRYPDRVGGLHARYRVLVFVHRSRPDIRVSDSSAEAARAVYTMTAWDREAGTLTHYDFWADRGWGMRRAAARLFWARARARFEYWGPRRDEREIPYLDLAAPDWGSMFVVDPPVFGALADLARRSRLPLAPAVTIYGVLGGCIELADCCAGARHRPWIPDDFDTATGLGPGLLPALYERVFMMLRAQDRVSIGPPERVVGTAGGHYQFENVFLASYWINKYLAVTGPSSLFRQRLHDRLDAYVPYEIDPLTMLLLFREELPRLAHGSRPPAAKQ